MEVLHSRAEVLKSRIANQLSLYNPQSTDHEVDQIEKNLDDLTSISAEMAQLLRDPRMPSRTEWAGFYRSLKQELNLLKMNFASIKNSRLTEKSPPYDVNMGSSTHQRYNPYCALEVDLSKIEEMSRYSLNSLNDQNDNLKRIEGRMNAIGRVTSLSLSVIDWIENARFINKIIMTGCLTAATILLS